MIRQIFIESDLQKYIYLKETKRINKVLRLKKGDQIILLNQKGERGLYRILNSKTGKLELITLLSRDIKSKRNINIFVALAKKQALEKLVYYGTFLGARNFYFFPAERSQFKNLSQSTLTRFKRIINSCLEITPWSHTPEIFSAKMEDLLKFKNSYALDQKGSKLEPQKLSENINIFVGPEGGWSSRELALFRENNVKIISLAPINLKIEITITIFLSLANFPF